MSSALVGRVVRSATAVAFLSLFLIPARALAQVAPPQQLDDATRPRIRVRGLSVNPTITVTDVGVDTNVFNSVTDPKRDFTMTLSPALDAWVRAGRARLALRGRTDLLYFQTYTSERSVDGGLGARLEVPLNRLSWWADGGTYSGRQRASYEIDVRSRRSVESYGFGTSYRAGAKTTLGLGVHRDKTSWDGDTEFFGVSLSRTLDRTADSASLTYRQNLTVLTTFVAEVTAQRDRFPIATERNTDSQRAVFGFDLGARALINGSARVGFRKFDAVSETFEPFAGAVASASIGYVLRGSSRFNLDLQRDTQYSFESNYPYYVQTGASLTLTQRLTNRWDFQARIGRQRLDYRAARTAVEAVPSRLDRIHQTGGGIGYRLNRGIRLGVNVDKNERHSPLEGRKYGGLKFGASVTYAR